MTGSSDQGRGWRAALAVYARPRVVGMGFLGFSAGLPFFLVGGTLSAWLAQAGVTRTAIGFLSWVGLVYSLKFFWAPVVDRLPLPVLGHLLGRRRSWMLVAQLGIVAGLLGMVGTDPATQIWHMTAWALLVAFASATQDISLDAWRIEAAPQSWQGSMAATYQAGYRVAKLTAAAGALYIAAVANWTLAYLAMAGLMAVGMVTVLLVAEPNAQASDEAVAREQQVVDFLDRHAHAPQWQRDAGAWFVSAAVCPFLDFAGRYGKQTALILVLVALYWIPDMTLGVMANPFYLDLGYTLKEIASITKIYGIVMTMVGVALGGVLVVRFNVMASLLIGIVLMAASNLSFAVLALVIGTGADAPGWIGLAGAIFMDNLAGGLAATVFIAYLSSLTSAPYTATQYALLSSLMALTGNFIGGFSGLVVDNFGYAVFFVTTALAGVPTFILTAYLFKYRSMARAQDWAEYRE